MLDLFLFLVNLCLEMAVQPWMELKSEESRTKNGSQKINKYSSGNFENLYFEPLTGALWWHDGSNC